MFLLYVLFSQRNVLSVDCIDPESIKLVSIEAVGWDDASMILCRTVLAMLLNEGLWPAFCLSAFYDTTRRH